jgi:hypothetical protein
VVQQFTDSSAERENTVRGTVSDDILSGNFRHTTASAVVVTVRVTAACGGLSWPEPSWTGDVDALPFGSLDGWGVGSGHLCSSACFGSWGDGGVSSAPVCGSPCFATGCAF